MTTAQEENKAPRAQFVPYLFLSLLFLRDKVCRGARWRIDRLSKYGAESTYPPSVRQLPPVPYPVMELRWRKDSKGLSERMKELDVLKDLKEDTRLPLCTDFFLWSHNEL